MIASVTHIQFTRRIAVFISHSFQDASFSNARCLCLPVRPKLEVEGDMSPARLHTILPAICRLHPAFLLWNLGYSGPLAEVW